MDCRRETIDALLSSLKSAEEINKISILESLEDGQAAQLACYVESLERWSRKIDLVSPAPVERLIDRHIIDSAAGTKLLLSAANLDGVQRIMDLGSGAGLPGLVAAVVNPERSFLLVEPREKRSYFLREMVRVLKLSNVEIARERVENLGQEQLEGVELVMARAVDRKVDLAAASEKCVKKDGKLAVFSADLSFEEAEKAIPPNRTLLSVIPYILPDGFAKRTIVLSASKNRSSNK